MAQGGAGPARSLSRQGFEPPSGGDIQTRAPKPEETATVPDLTTFGLPAEATVDPFNGQPLRVKRDPRGWVVYSVGPNGKDDGGRFENAADIGVGPVEPEPLHQEQRSKNDDSR